MDRGQRWIAARGRLRPEMDDKRWITSGDGSWDGMDCDQIWMDDRRWRTGGGWQEMNHGRRITMNLLPFREDIEVIRSFTLLEIPTLRSNYATMQLLWNTDMEAYDVLAAWLHRVWYRALFRDARIMQLHARVSMPNTIPNQIPESQLQSRYCSSRTRLIFGGATIFKEGDDSAGIATTPTASNYRTGCAGTKHRETHSPIEKASSAKCTWRGINHCTPKTVKSAPRQVMPNAPTNELRSRMCNSQSWMRSRLSLGHPNSVSRILRYTAATGKHDTVMD